MRLSGLANEINLNQILFTLAILTHSLGKAQASTKPFQAEQTPGKARQVIPFKPVNVLSCWVLQATQIAVRPEPSFTKRGSCQRRSPESWQLGPAVFFAASSGFLD